MNAIKCITERDLKGANPLWPSSGLSQDFVLFNMGPGEGIWLVDKQHSKYEAIMQTALEVALTYGDTETAERIHTMRGGAQCGDY